MVNMLDYFVGKHKLVESFMCGKVDERGVVMAIVLTKLSAKYYCGI